MATSGVKLYIHFLNMVVQFIVFLTLSTLICRSTDISKCFSPLEFEITRVNCNTHNNSERERERERGRRRGVII